MPEATAFDRMSYQPPVLGNTQFLQYTPDSTSLSESWTVNHKAIMKPPHLEKPGISERWSS